MEKGPQRRGPFSIYRKKYEMISIHDTRPFNTRYVIRERSSRYTPELLRTHRTAQASYAYINRQNSVDEWGPTPNWAARSDLAAAGRCAPARAADPKLSGIALWAQADDNACRYRPDEPTIAHCVGSLPRHEDALYWRNLIEGFAEDYLVARGMVVDWAIHHQAATDDQPEIAPHVHLLITLRGYDPEHRDYGKVRQNWLRTDNSRKRLAERWWAWTGIVPPQYVMAAATSQISS